jgi:alpha-N-arabinofuranosidase
MSCGRFQKLRRMAPDKIDATVQMDKTPEVQVEEQSLGSLPNVVSVRPFRVNIYSYPVYFYPVQ